MKVQKWMVIGILICFIGPVVFEGAYVYGAEGGKQSSSGGSNSSSSDSGGGGASTPKQSLGQRIKAGVQKE
jgi:hypothetical protein